MPALYSTLTVDEPGYGRRIVRVHALLHRDGIPQTEGVDLVTGERVLLPIGTRWDSGSGRDVKLAADGWRWSSTPLRDAERAAGLPAGCLPSAAAERRGGRPDIWVDERLRNAAFIALLTVVANHTEITFCEVAWREWVHVRQPRSSRVDTNAPLLDRPTPSSYLLALGDLHSPYPLGGRGHIERYASSLCRLLDGHSSPAVISAEAAYPTLSAAVIADIENDHEQIVAWQQRENPLHRLHADQPADMPVLRSAAEISSLIGWSPAILADLDATHQRTKDRLAAETAALRPQGAPLSLF